MTVHTDDPRRRLLARIPPVRLAEWGRQHGIPSSAGEGREVLIDSLIASKRFPSDPRGILAQMAVPELGVLCRELGGMGTSVDRTRLEERILTLLDPEPPTVEEAPGPSPLPVGAWIEGRRKDAAHREDRERRREHQRIAVWIRAAVWGAFFAGLGWLGVFSHTSDALLLGLGVTAVAGIVYRFRPPIPLAMTLAVGELVVRLGLIGMGPAAIFTLVMLCLAEILCAAAMALDAESARLAEVTIGFRQHLDRATPDPAPPREREEVEAPPETPPDLGDPFSKQP